MADKCRFRRSTGDSRTRTDRPARGAIFVPSPALILRAHAGPDRLTDAPGSPGASYVTPGATAPGALERFHVGSVIKKRRKRMAKKKHRKLLKKTRVQRRKLGK